MKLFVWDFHGVLEKGNDHAVLEITNIALEKHGYARRMTAEEAELLAGRRWYEYFSFLVPEQDNSEHQHLHLTCQEIVRNQPDILTRYIQLNDHADYVLNTIQERKYPQILISNTPPYVLDLFVELVGIAHYFPTTHRFGVDAHHNPTLNKRDCLINYLQDSPSYEGLVAIGDSPADVALSELHPQGTGYLYTHPNRIHRPANCHYKIQDLRCILQEL